MHTLRDVRVAILDLDGTLVDSVADIATHVNAALAGAGLPPRSLAWVRAHVGHGATQLLDAAAEQPDLTLAVLAAFRDLYRARPVIETRVYAGLDAALDAIAPGRRLAVLSNKPHDLTTAIAAELLARWPFAAVVGHRPGALLKPDPGVARAIADELGAPAAACAVIGDSEVDVETARNAGMISVAVAWGLRDRDALVAARPDHLVDTPAELAALFAA
jgi:phosphoglycolate phosphatase